MLNLSLWIENMHFDNDLFSCFSELLAGMYVSYWKKRLKKLWKVLSKLENISFHGDGYTARSLQHLPKLWEDR